MMKIKDSHKLNVFKLENSSIGLIDNVCLITQYIYIIIKESPWKFAMKWTNLQHFYTNNLSYKVSSGKTEIKTCWNIELFKIYKIQR